MDTDNRQGLWFVLVAIAIGCGHRPTVAVKIADEILREFSKRFDPQGESNEPKVLRHERKV
jgi:hypothetical protein